MSWVRDADNESLSVNSFSRNTGTSNAFICLVKATVLFTSNNVWRMEVDGTSVSYAFGDMNSTVGEGRLLTRVRRNTDSVGNTTLLTEFSLDTWLAMGAFIPPFTGAASSRRAALNGLIGAVDGTWTNLDPEQTYLTAMLGAVTSNARAKFAHWGWYTGLTPAQFNTLYNAIHADGSTFKSHTHPDVVALGHTPYFRATLETDGTVQAGGLTLANNNGSFDSGDNPTMAAEGGGPAGVSGNRMYGWW